MAQIIGSILIGADELVGEMVKSRIPHMRGEAWGHYTALGVIRRGVLLGGVVYHAFRGHDIQMSAAFDRVGWALPGTLRALMSYPFDTMGCVRVTAITGRKNKRARKLITDLGFTLEGVSRRNLDGKEDACCYGLLKADCKWIEHGQKATQTAAAA